MSKKKKSKKKRKLKRKFKYCIFFIICLSFSLTFVAFTTCFEQGKLDKIKQEAIEQKKRIQENEYNSCLNEKYNDKDNTEELKNKGYKVSKVGKSNSTSKTSSAFLEVPSKAELELKLSSESKSLDSGKLNLAAKMADFEEN